MTDQHWGLETNKMNRNIAILTLIAGIIIAGGGILRASDQNTDNSGLKAMVVANDTSIPDRAISLALEAGRADILIYAMNNPNDDIKIKAVKAITHLPPKESANALASILSLDALWQKHIKGGEGLMLQDAFNSSLKDAILKVTGIDPGAIDLFNAEARGGLRKHVNSFAK